MNFDPGTMKENWKNGVCYLTFPSLEALPFIRHAFSTRLGGISRDEFSSMNLAYGRRDPEENVTENYRRFCAAAGFEFDSLVSSSQDHHTYVRRIGRENRGEGFARPKPAGVDGLMTNEPGVTLVTHYADCVPLYFADPVHKAIALSHAGWRGTAKGIGEVTVRSMAVEFGTRPQDLVCAIGPSIGPCCFEVDAPVYDVFAGMKDLIPSEWTREDGGGKYHVDLWEANRRMLMRAGVKEQNISLSGICTMCSAEVLFSHRASRGKRGGLSAFLELKEDADADRTL